MSLEAAFSSAASRVAARTLLSPTSLLTRLAASLTRPLSESARVTDSTSAERAMSKAAAEPILPAPITRRRMEGLSQIDDGRGSHEGQEGSTKEGCVAHSRKSGPTFLDRSTREGACATRLELRKREHRLEDV